MKRLMTILAVLAAAAITARAARVTDHGAWCWFADPRALHHQTPDGLTDMTYVGYIDTQGNIKAMQYDHNARTATEVLVRSYFQPDDHDNPTFLVVPDGRVMVFYSRHTDEPCFYYRISRTPGDITTLGEEMVIPTEHNTTYPSPFVLADDPGHFYLCWRGINWHPTIARLSLPDAGGRVSVVDGPYQIVQSTGARPYAKYTSDGSHRIGMAYTTGHPDNENPNYLYYNYIDIRDLSLRDVCGERLCSIAAGPWAVDKTTEYTAQHPASVVDDVPYRQWVWQLVLDRDTPVIAMTRISHDKKSHNYYMARWDGSAWQKHHVAHGGGHFHQSPRIEHCYSGGMALDPADPCTVYCSVPVTGAHGKVYEIVRYTLDDNGEIVYTEAVTSNSEKNCVRPYMVGSSPDDPLRLLWMQGDYYDWIVSRDYPGGYDTSIKSDFKGFVTETETDADDFANETESDAESLVTETPGTHAADGATVSFVWDFDASEPLRLVLGGEVLTYFVDPATLYPEITHGGTTYRSTNRMATSNSWRTAPRATDGRWHEALPNLNTEVILTLDSHGLRSYVNGLLDQRIDLPATK